MHIVTKLSLKIEKNMKTKENYLIEECRHCGNKTKLDIVGHYKEEYREVFDCNIDWLILRCCACEQISFAKVYAGEDTEFYTQDGEIDWEEQYSTLYPIMTYENKNVPKPVHSAFSVALKAQHVDDALCLISLRRTLEIVCKDKQAKGNNLVAMIQDLTDKSIFPTIINEASDILRILGNEAAHGDNIEYDWSIVKEMVNFTQIIIEYVYVIPFRIENIKKEISLCKQIPF